VSIKDSSYARFRRALQIGDLALIRHAAMALPRVPLDDALRVCLLMAEQDHDAFDRAAVRWLARFALEAKDVDLTALYDGLDALNTLRTKPEEAKHALIELCATHGLRARRA
jgi:hypothetical protein